MPAPASRPNMSSERAEIRRARQSNARKNSDQRGRPDQAELLACDREHEIGVLLGHETRLSLRPVEQALPEQPAVADRDPGLRGVVAGSARIVGRVEEGREAVQLITVQHAELRRRRRRRSPQRARGRTASASAPGDGEHAEHRHAEHQHRAEVGLSHDQRRGNRGERERRDDVTCRAAGAAACEPRSSRPAAGPDR